MSTPTPGKRISVRVDEHLAANLALLAEVGMSVADIVRIAVGDLAAVHRNAWDAGIPRGTLVYLEDATVVPVEDAEAIVSDKATAVSDTVPDASDKEHARV